MNDTQSSPKSSKHFIMKKIAVTIVNDKLVSDYEEKLIILIDLLLLNAHPLMIIIKFLTHVVFNTEEKFSSINYCDEDVINIIRNLDINKAHGFDNWNGQVRL